jgi:hypothetical protein
MNNDFKSLLTPVIQTTSRGLFLCLLHLKTKRAALTHKLRVSRLTMGMSDVLISVTFVTIHRRQNPLLLHQCAFHTRICLYSLSIIFFFSRLKFDSSDDVCVLLSFFCESNKIGQVGRYVVPFPVVFLRGV